MIVAPTESQAKPWLPFPESWLSVTKPSQPVICTPHPLLPCMMLWRMMKSQMRSNWTPWPENLSILQSSITIASSLGLYFSALLRKTPWIGFLRFAPSLQEQSAEVDSEGAGNVEETLRLVRIQEQHGAGIAAVSPLGFRQHRRMRMNLQIVAEIPARWEIGGPA